MRILKVLSLLLAYPSRDLQKALPAVLAEIELAALPDGIASALGDLAREIAAADIYEAQEAYVHLFDRTRTLSLHLFEHVHGESRDRGQAMVDLKDTYERAGYAIDAAEMPDHLPLFLEFLSLQPEAEARALLGQTAHILTALRQRLAKREAAYAAAFEALEAIAAEPADEGLLGELMETPDDDPDDLAALDRVWEEEAVTFGANAGEGACGPDRLRTRIRAANRPPEPVSNLGAA